MHLTRRRTGGDAPDVSPSRLSLPAQCALTLLFVALTTAVLGVLDRSWGVFRLVAIENPGVAYVAPVMAAAVLFGVFPAAVALLASFACIGLFFAARESVQEVIVLLVTILLLIVFVEGQRRARGHAEGLLRDLARERSRTQRVFEATPFGLGLFRADDLSVVDANPAYAAQLEEYTGVPFAPNYPLATYLPAYPDTEAGRLIRLAATENRTVRRERYTSAAQPDRYYDWTLQPMPLDDGAAGVLLSIEEVTERVRDERVREALHRRLEAERELTRRVLDAVPVGIGLFRPDDYAILDANPVYAAHIREVYGAEYRPGMALPATVPHFADLPIARDLRTAAAEGRTVRRDEYEPTTYPDHFYDWTLQPLPLGDGTTGALLTFADVTERVRGEREREALLARVERERALSRRIFDAAPGGVAIYDPDTFAVLDANPGYIRFLESLGVRYIPGFSPTSVTPDFAKGEMARTIRRAVAEDRAIRTPRYHSVLDTERYFDYTAQPLDMGDGKTAALITIADITEREWLLAQVEQQAAELEASFAATVDGIAIYDAAGRTLRRNRANHEILHLDPERPWDRFEIIARRNMRHPDGSPILPDEMHTSRALRGEMVRGEILLITDDDGRDHYLRQNAAPIRGADGAITGAILVTNDITGERARATERAALVGQVGQQTAELETAFGAMLDGIVVYDTEGRVVRRNAAYYDLLRLDPAEEWPRERVLRTLHLRTPDGTPIPPERGHVSRALRGETVRDAVICITDGAGEERYLRENAAPVRAANGDVVGAVLVFSDDTGRLRRERERDDLVKLMEERREFAQTIFDTVPVCLAVIDTDTMQYHAVNPAYRAAVPESFRGRDLFGLTMPDVFPGDENAAFRERVREAGQRNTTYSERAARYDDPARGPTYWDEMAVPLSVGNSGDGDGAGRFVLLQVMDVTERIEAQGRIVALAEAEAARAGEFEAVFASLAEGLLLVDAKGRITRTNPAAAEILALDGVPLTSVKEFRDRFETAGDGDEPAKFVTLDTLRHGGATTFTRRFRNGRGELRTLRLLASAIHNGSGEVTGSVVTFADTTREGQEAEERIRLTAEVQARAAQLETIINSIPDGISIGDATGQQWQFNPAARRIFGMDTQFDLPPAERTAYYRIRGGDDIPIPPEELPSARAARGESFSAAEYILATPGGDRVLATSGAPIRDAAGAITGSVLIYSDITARRRTDRVMTRLGRTLDASSNEIYVLSATDFRVVQANEGARRNLGYDADELAERSLLDLAPGLDGEMLHLLVEPLRDDEERETVVEMQLRRSDGTLYPAEARLYLSHEENPPVFVAIVQDITERHAAVRQREEFFREIDERRRFAQAVVETVPAGIAVFSADDAFRVRLYNREYLHLFGEPWRSRGLIGLGSRDFVPDFEESGLLDLYRQVRDTGETINLREYPNGGFSRGEAYFDFVLVPLRETGDHVTGLLLHVQEVTERVQARLRIEELGWEAAQRASELETVIASIADGVIVTNAAGEITLENAAMRHMMGRTEAAGTFALAAPGADAGVDRVGTRIAILARDMPLARAERGETTTDQVITMHDPDSGTERFLLCSSAPVRSPDGTVAGAVGVFRDITEMKQVEQMKDDFISIAAHELRTPLTAIKGYAELLDRRLSHLEGRERDRQPLGVIRKQADRLAKLVNEMLDVSRIEGGRLQLNREAMNLSALAGETVNNLRVTSDLHTLTLDPAPDVAVFADPSRIEQVLINLVSNAITYSPEGGEVAVRVAAEGENAVVSVRDSGIGIPPDALQQIFSRFYRAEEASVMRTGGMGLGLYICREIVERHGGTITAESVVGAGSTFTFTLPLVVQGDGAGK